MSILNEIQEQLQKGKAKVVTAKVEEALSSGVAPQEIMQVLLDAMGDIGERFKRDEVFVPDVMIAARAMNRGLAALKPHLLDGGVKAQAGRRTAGSRLPRGRFLRTGQRSSERAFPSHRRHSRW